MAQLHQVPVRIPWSQARPNGLSALLVYADLPGRHPLVVITHGTPRGLEPRSKINPWQLLPQAQWFARRGFVTLIVVRRGYGDSSGRPDYLGNGICPQTNYEAAARSSAEDLRVAIAYGTTLPQVDPTRTIAVGVSTGGMAAVALTVDPPANLVAAINFAGGRGSLADHNVCNPSSLINAFSDLGRHSHTPMLWIYAANDRYFWPELARQFDFAFESAGGNVQFVPAPASGDDGHSLFTRGIDLWEPTVDDFLKAHKLEALPQPISEVDPDVDPPPGLPERMQKGFHDYVLLGPHKAFAMSPHHFGSAVAQMSLAEARKHARENCARAVASSHESCTIVFEDNTPVK